MDSIVIAAATLILNAVVIVWTMAWKSRGIVSHVDLALAKHDSKIVKALNEHQLSDTSEFGVIRREFGETGTALRQKISEVELWARDHFVRTDLFSAVTDSRHKEIRARFDKVEERLDRIREIQEPVKS